MSTFLRNIMGDQGVHSDTRPACKFLPCKCDPGTKALPFRISDATLLCYALVPQLRCVSTASIVYATPVITAASTTTAKGRKYIWKYV